MTITCFICVLDYRVEKHVFYLCQVTELRAKLTATKDYNNTQKRQLDDLQNEYRRMEHQLLTVKEERDNA